MVEVANHMQRHSVHPSDFLHLKLSGFEELGFIVGNGNRLVFHALFQHGDFVAVAGAVGSPPGIPYFLRVFNGVRVFQHAGGGRSIRII